MHGHKSLGSWYVCIIYRIIFHEGMDNVMWSKSIEVLNPYEALRCNSTDAEIVHVENCTVRHKVAIFLRKLANAIDN